jgi:hypothetical protein
MSVPIIGALDAVNSFRAAGFDVVIYTCREAEQVREWLVKWGFPNLDVTHAKRHWHALVDDKAFRFHGRWSQLLIDRVIHEQTWWQQAIHAQRSTQE